MACHFKITLVFILAILSGQLNAQKCATTSKYFNVDSVTRVKVHGGVDGAGTDMTYLVYFKVKKKFDMFDSAWAFNNRSLIILMTPKGSSPVFRKNKKFSLLITIHYNSDPRTESVMPAMVAPPLNCKEELLLRYRKGKKYNYIALSKFIQLRSINLP